MSVTYKRVKRGFRSTMPSSIARRHESAKYGDAQSAIRRSKSKALDTNTQIVRVHWNAAVGERDIVILGHWRQLGLNGYTHYIGTDGKLHKLSPQWRNRTFQQWIDANGGTLKALNRLRKKGSRFARRPEDYPMSWGQAVKYAERYNALMIPEYKDRANSEAIEYMRWTCERFNYPLWPMKLIWQSGTEEVAAAFRRAGVQVAIIFGNKPKLAKGRNLVADWKYKPTRVWGPAPARDWI